MHNWDDLYSTVLSERSQKQACADSSLGKETELTEGGASWGAIAGGHRALT